MRCGGSGPLAVDGVGRRRPLRFSGQWSTSTHWIVALDTTIVGDGSRKTMLPKVPSFSCIELPESALAVLSHRAHDRTLGPRLISNRWDMSEVNDDMIRAELSRCLARPTRY